MKRQNIQGENDSNTRSGSLPYTLTNDYLFRAVFQSRPKALEGLCRSILHLCPQDAVSIRLRNPVELGRQIESKEFILDIALLINGSLFLNLEMQMYHDRFWVERSLSYACRSYDSLNHGEDYATVLPVIHTGFLSYDLFPEHPEFFSTYQLANLKNQQIYSDKLRIHVVNLNRIQIATPEDRANSLDLWANVMKATTWEEVNMLAQKNEYLQETVSGILQLTEDEMVRQQCQAREDFNYWERMKKLQHQRELKALNDALLEKDAALQEKNAALQEKDAALQAKDAALQEKNAAIQEKDAQLSAALARITELEAEKNGQ